MASPQKENGHTIIAHEILEVISQTNFNGTQFRILLFILRYTYGFHRKSHEFSLKFLSDGTKCNKQQIKREIDKLISENVIKVYRESDYNNTRILGFNKNYDGWFNKKTTVSELDDSKLISVQSAKQSTVSELANEQYAKQSTPPVSGLAYQEIYSSFKYIKDTTTTGNVMIQILNSYCEIHNKIDLHLKPSERTAMQLLSNSDIPLEFILESMKSLHDKKIKDGDKVTSFLYYPDAIADAWKRRTTVIDFKPKKISREEEILRKFLEGS
jgi:phage replication O-like protein O